MQNMYEGLQQERNHYIRALCNNNKHPHDDDIHLQQRNIHRPHSHVWMERRLPRLCISANSWTVLNMGSFYAASANSFYCFRLHIQQIVRATSRILCRVCSMHGWHYPSKPWVLLAAEIFPERLHTQTHSEEDASDQGSGEKHQRQRSEDLSVLETATYHSQNNNQLNRGLHLIKHQGFRIVHHHSINTLLYGVLLHRHQT